MREAEKYFKYVAKLVFPTAIFSLSVRLPPPALAAGFSGIAVTTDASAGSTVDSSCGSEVTVVGLLSCSESTIYDTLGSLDSSPCPASTVPTNERFDKEFEWAMGSPCCSLFEMPVTRSSISG